MTFPNIAPTLSTPAEYAANAATAALYRFLKGPTNIADIDSESDGEHQGGEAYDGGMYADVNVTNDDGNNGELRHFIVAHRELTSTTDLLSTLVSSAQSIGSDEAWSPWQSRVVGSTSSPLLPVSADTVGSPVH